MSIPHKGGQLDHALSKSREQTGNLLHEHLLLLRRDHVRHGDRGLEPIQGGRIQHVGAGKHAGVITATRRVTRCHQTEVRMRNNRLFLGSTGLVPQEQLAAILQQPLQGHEIRSRATIHLILQEHRSVLGSLGDSAVNPHSLTRLQREGAQVARRLHILGHVEPNERTPNQRAQVRNQARLAHASRAMNVRLVANSPSIQDRLGHFQIGLIGRIGVRDQDAKRLGPVRVIEDLDRKLGLGMRQNVADMLVTRGDHDGCAGSCLRFALSRSTLASISGAFLLQLLNDGTTNDLSNIRGSSRHGKSPVVG